MAAPRRSNTASLSDIQPILKASLPANLDGDFEYPQGLTEFIVEFDSLLRQLLRATPRVTQTLIEQALLKSF